MHRHINAKSNSNFKNSKHLYSYYQAFVYDRGKQYTLKLRYISEDDIYSNTNGSFVEIYEGFHSYVDKEKLLRQLNTYLHNYFLYQDLSISVATYIVGIKCIIPKGSNYYIGNFNHMKSYVSDTIIISKRIFKVK